MTFEFEPREWEWQFIYSHPLIALTLAVLVGTMAARLLTRDRGGQ